MLTLPTSIVTILSAFAALFSRRTFRHAQTLVVGSILTPGRRTVTNALRAMGLHQERHFQNYHRVLNRAKWSSRQASGILLRLLVRFFAPTGPLVFGIDETLERRQGDKIAAKGIYRDSARSSTGLGPLQQRILRQEQWLALDQSDAPIPDSLGGKDLGTALPQCARPIGTL